MDWASSVFNLTPSLSLEVVAPTLRVRQNKDILQGSKERMIVELHNSSLPSIHISAVIVTIPSPERRAFRRRMTSMLFTTCQFFWELRDQRVCLPYTIYDMHDTFRELCSFRYAYIGTPGSMAEEFGGTNDELPECLIRPSLHFTAALWYVIELTSITNQKH